MLVHEAWIFLEQIKPSECGIKLQSLLGGSLKVRHYFYKGWFVLRVADRFKRVIRKNKFMYAVCGCIRHPSRAKRRLATYCCEFLLVMGRPRGVASQCTNNESIVVSLTSYGKRLAVVHLAILSIMRQTVRPNRIVLWLDECAGSELVPAALKELEEYGLEIRYGCEDLKGHKKYYWALREFSDACVITIDDDVMYPNDTIETLMTAHKRFPDAVIGRRVHRMTSNGDELAPYTDWEFEWHRDCVPRKDLLATGVGGILYPPNCFSACAFDLSPIFGTDLANDDLWLKANEILEGRYVAWAPCTTIHPYAIDDSQEDGLFLDNVGCGGNDKSICAIEHGLGIDFVDCIHEGENEG